MPGGAATTTWVPGGARRGRTRAKLAEDLTQWPPAIRITAEAPGWGATSAPGPTGAAPGPLSAHGAPARVAADRSADIRPIRLPAMRPGPTQLSGFYTSGPPGLPCPGRRRPPPGGPSGPPMYPRPAPQRSADDQGSLPSPAVARPPLGYRDSASGIFTHPAPPADPDRPQAPSLLRWHRSCPLDWHILSGCR